MADLRGQLDTALASAERAHRVVRLVVDSTVPARGPGQWAVLARLEDGGEIVLVQGAPYDWASCEACRLWAEEASRARGLPAPKIQGEADA